MVRLLVKRAKQLHGQLLTQRYSHRRSKNMHTSTSIITYIIHIYISIWPHKKGGRKNRVTCATNTSWKYVHSTKRNKQKRLTHMLYRKLGCVKIIIKTVVNCVNSMQTCGHTPRSQQEKSKTIWGAQKMHLAKSTVTWSRQQLTKKAKLHVHMHKYEGKKKPHTHIYIHTQLQIPNLIQL